MSKIYDFTFSYSLTKRYVNFAFKQFYSHFIVVGKKNIPLSSPVIFAPNHVNALMDALAILASAPHHLSIVFLARADLFNNKIIARVLRFTKIMPAFRMRDGIENLGKNNEIFDRCVEVLDHQKPLGIMPEGNQGDQKKIRPLVKGIFRIAFAAQQKYGHQPGVKIIPVGIDYTDSLKFGKPIILQFGKPIEVADYMEQHLDNAPLATNAIREKLKQELSNLTLDIQTKEYYAEYQTIIEVVVHDMLQNEPKISDTYLLFIKQNEVAKKIAKIEKSDTEKMKILSELSKEYRLTLDDLQLKTNVLTKKPASTRVLVFEGLGLLLTLPVFIIGFILNVLPFYIPVLLRKYVLKAKDVGFFSSLHFGIGIITFPIFYVLQTFLFSITTGFSWWLCLFFFISQLYLGKIALAWYRKTRKLVAKFRYNILKNTSSMKRLEVVREAVLKTFNAL